MQPPAVFNQHQPMTKHPASGDKPHLGIGHAPPSLAAGCNGPPQRPTCSAPATALDAFAAAWNTRSPDARQRYLALALSNGARFTDPWVDIAGRARIAAHIASARARHPGSRWLVTSSVRLRSSVLVFEWCWLDQGCLLLAGWSAAAVGKGQRFTSVASNCKAPPPSFAEAGR